MEFEIQLFTKKLRRFTSDSNDLNNKCITGLKRLSSLVETIRANVNLIRFEPNDNEQYVNAYDIEEFGCELQHNIYCPACEVSFVKENWKCAANSLIILVSFICIDKLNFE